MTQGALGSLGDPTLGWPGPQAGLAAGQTAVAGPAIQGSPGHQEQQLRLFGCKCEKPAHPSWFGKVRDSQAKVRTHSSGGGSELCEGRGQLCPRTCLVLLSPDKPPCPEPRCLPHPVSKELLLEGQRRLTWASVPAQDSGCVPAPTGEVPCGGGGTLERGGGSWAADTPKVAPPACHAFVPTAMPGSHPGTSDPQLELREDATWTPSALVQKDVGRRPEF